MIQSFQKKKIAVIGAGISGITSAVECIDHGHSVVLYDDGDAIGGIWRKVNTFSGLQIHGATYMFHPEVRWKTSFPQRDEILTQLRLIWERRDGPTWTKFNTPVIKVEHYGEDQMQWRINGTDVYDGIIIATGTCHNQKWPHINGLSSFEGSVVHAADLEKLDPARDVRDKNVVIIGSGASAIEALEWCLKLDAKKTTILSRTHKWIIPRNILLHAFVSMLPNADTALVSKSVQWMIKNFVYGKDETRQSLIPDYDFYRATPCCNSNFFSLLENKEQVKYASCTIDKVEPSGVHTIQKPTKQLTKTQVKPLSLQKLWIPRVTKPDLVLTPVPSPVPTSPPSTCSSPILGSSKQLRDMSSSCGGLKDDLETGQVPAYPAQFVPADTIIMATGYTRPSYKFMPHDMQDVPTDLFMLGFHPDYPTCLFNNGTYLEGVATAASYHINVDTRIFLMFLQDPNTRPDKKKTWAHVKAVKRPGFLTYANKIWWQLSFVASDKARWRHASHVILGEKFAWLKAVVRESTKTFLRTVYDKVETLNLFVVEKDSEKKIRQVSKVIN